MTQMRPYRLFDVVLARKDRLSTHLWRLTFSGPQVGQMRTCGPDQRIKIFFPDAQGRPAALEDRPDWYAIYKTRPIDSRPPMRTYTIRSLRADEGEVDVDFVLHGDTGPASRWASRAEPGDPVQMTAPNRAFDGDPGGYEWKPPNGLRQALLIADETALPAVAGILETLAERANPPRTDVHVEIPSPGDEIALPRWDGLRVRWSPREGAAHGAGMIAAANAFEPPRRLELAQSAPTLDAIDIEAVLPWERADPIDPTFYAWVAGESAAVMAIRRRLIGEAGLERRAINLMGYWRAGRALD